MGYAIQVSIFSHSRAILLGSAGSIATLLVLGISSAHAASACYQDTARVLSTRSLPGTDVTNLQQILNRHAVEVGRPDMRVAPTGPGSPGQETRYFGFATRQAVIQFQNYYASQVLTPLNLNQGTGIVGEATKKFLAARYGCGSVAPSAATATPVSTDAALPTVHIRGTIRYEHSAIAIPNVTVDLFDTQRLDTPLATALTDATGSYTFSQVPTGKSYRITPRKRGEFRNAVSSADATRILQHTSSKNELAGNRLLAADVTGDGAVSSLDASRLLQFVVGKTGTLPPATRCESDWLFVPVEGTAPRLAKGKCVIGSLEINTLSAEATGRDFTGVLIGDVNANWQ